MRAVKAKHLRKLARHMSIGMPERSLLTIDTIKKVKVTNEKHPEFGKTIDVRMQSAVNDPDTFRGRYRQIKKLFGKEGMSHVGTLG
jgi:hypothetical protein